MANVARLRVGLIGLGNVGAQVARRLLEHRDEIRRRAGLDVELCRVLVRDPSKPRPLTLPAGLLTASADELLDDPEIDAIVELAGGEEPARTWLERAIRNRKHVVTANKLVMAKHGPELLDLAGKMNVDVYFEAAVGGGIPLISTFKVDLLANQIERIAAIINGTTNYILDRMSSSGLPFATALAEAQAAGYAEADPTDDVEGFDAVYKLAIMASIAFATRVRPEQVYREGITRVEPVDFKYARELGYEIKLLAYAARAGGSLEARVHPVMVPLGHPLSQVEGAYNAVWIEGDLVGPVFLRGQGAGGKPTASSVVGDVIDLGRSIHREVQTRAALAFEHELPVLPMDDVVTRAYLRCTVADRPGVLASIFQVFGEERVSISSAIQKEVFEGEEAAEFVVTTHPAPDGALRRMRERIADLDCVSRVSQFLRVL